MLTVYIRSSSYNNWYFCQMQYYLNYILGMPRKSGKKADKGTIVHKILEYLAIMKYGLQTNDTYTLNDSIVDTIKVDKTNWMQPYQLSNIEVENVNRTRINKWTYKVPCKIKYGHIRYGVPLVEDIIQKTFDYYKDNTPHDWKPVDFKDITNWTWMELDYKEGMFDPRKLDIVKPEQSFDIELTEPWAKYNFTVNNEKITGNLRFRGTIDLITSPKSGILEIIDYKTGQRLDWATGEIKDYEKLQKDPQLRLYHYATSKLYPDIDQIFITIFFIRDGGPFTIVFDKSNIEETENILAKHFDEIQKCTLPQMIDSFQKCFKCTKICDYYKMKSPESKLNMCQYIYHQIRTTNINEVTNIYNNGRFNVYEAPGEVENEK